ncbi:MAG: B12-binding domain-containing radical SAM protein [Armatimonadetes bacterium]|nr:B12-binding domain-containing radical SAM protein [Armatimonadota bacterium]
MSGKDKPRLLIVSPAWCQGWWRGGKVLAPPLSLPLLAGLTPRDVDVKLIDENVERLDPNAPADWVALTVPTASAPRAYEMAAGFRARGIPVVMGGIHPTVLPDEVAQHADAVVIGEAEGVWREVIGDLMAGRLQPRYQAPGFHDLVGLPRPRRELLHTDRYLTINVVQTARGCPHGCTFCTVSSIFGGRYRFRPVPEVVEEVRGLGGWVGFVDDNIVGDRRRAKELFEALIPLKLRWISQGDLTMAKDPELLRLAKLSGCQAMYIGLESISDENLRATNKKSNLNCDMGEAIGKIHRAGIEIIGSFVLGLDGDDTTVFARTAAFARKHKLVAAQFSALTPFPGTVTNRELEAEGRIEDRDWSHYTMSNVVFSPKQMTSLQLHEGQVDTYRRFYSIPSILQRALTGRGNLAARLLVNFSYRRLHAGKGLCKGLPAHTPVAPSAATDAPGAVAAELGS